MAVTITRTAWIDDDGTGTSGTVINNAEKTTIYNQIDAALAQLAQLAGGNNFTGSQTIAGLLNVVGFGVNQFVASGPGSLSLQIQNTSATATSKSEIALGNNANAALLDIVSYSSGFTPTVGFDQPNGSVLYQGGAGGLSLVAGAGAGTIRVYTGGITERMRVTSGGELWVNTSTPFGCKIAIGTEAASPGGIAIQNYNPSNVCNFILFYNSAVAVAGNIAQTGATGVSYGTASDARLKTDRGRATTLDALRALVVHDFVWNADGSADRGVFAQDTYHVFPRAIQQGTDEMTDEGTLKHPWMTDYSKFVPDLIVGWQQHDAELAALRAAFATLKGSTDAQ